MATKKAATAKAAAARRRAAVPHAQTARPVRHEAPDPDDNDDDLVGEEEPDTRPAPSIKVRATKDGYYDDKRRRVGDVFRIRPPYDHNVANSDEPERIKTVNEFSKKWMKRVSKSTPERITTGRTVLQQHHDDEMKARRGEPDNPANSEGVID